MARILFVDDEPAIRDTLPAILRLHGHQVAVSATVAEALSEIASGPFEALIADLNIGEPGDGFTVVSAMRRTHPDCVNIILTGYPGFESALKAIQAQVDDYLVKPANVKAMLATIEQNIQNCGRRHPPRIIKSVARILREHTAEIITHTLDAMKSHPELSRLPLSDAQRADHIPGVLEELETQLESARPTEISTTAICSAAEHGRTRRQQGYPLTGIIVDSNLLQHAIYDVVQANLLHLDVSNLFIDLKRINDGLDDRLQQSLKAFVTPESHAA